MNSTKDQEKPDQIAILKAWHEKGRSWEWRRWGIAWVFPYYFVTLNWCDMEGNYYTAKNALTLERAVQLAMEAFEMHQLQKD